MNKFILVDKNQEMVDAWRNEFKYHDNFEFHCGDIFEKSADYLVSPANSFGFMDGGIDLAYSKKIGWYLQEKLQEKIKNEFDLELLVGQACVIETDFPQYPYMIAAPTMRVPMYLQGTPNVYLAAKAVFSFMRKTNDNTSCCIPGLGTGIGCVSYSLCAQKMRLAYEDFYLGKAVFPNKLMRANIKHIEELT